jgi:hypothetical protein
MKIMFLILTISALCFGNKQWDEVLNYTASFGGVNVANASFSSKRFINSENKNILKIQFVAKSKPSLNFIFPINDKIIIDVDLNTWEPIKVQKKINQGNYKQNSLATFISDEKMFIYKKDTIYYNDKVVNPYSLIYFFRTEDLTTSKNHEIQVVDNKKIIPLRFFVDERKKVRTSSGSYFANKIWPQKVDGSAFKNAGKITIWISEEEKLPLLINLKMKYGSLKLELSRTS